MSWQIDQSLKKTVFRSERLSDHKLTLSFCFRLKVKAGFAAAIVLLGLPSLSSTVGIYVKGCFY